MRQAARPALSCVLALCAALAAPACLARQSATVQTTAGAEPSAATEEPAAAAREEDSRSAFGRVMSIMIAALKQQADAPGPRGAATAADTATPASQAPPSAASVHQIQVGAAFRLDQATVASDTSTRPSQGSDQ